MKKLIVNIILALLFQGSSYSEMKYPKLLKILVNEQESRSRVSLFFDKNIDYTSRLDSNVVSIILSKCMVDKNFPGSEFQFLSGNISKVNFYREKNGDIQCKINLKEECDYFTEFLKESKLLIINLFPSKQIKENEKEFISGLKQQKTGNQNEALKIYRKLISKDYKNPEMYYHIGIIRDTLGYLYQAKSNYQTAVSLNYDLPEVYSKLANLYEKQNQKDLATSEIGKFNKEIENIKKQSLDSSIVRILKGSKELVDTDSILLALDNKNDSLKLAGNQGNKLSEPIIVRSEPIKSSTQIYAILTNIIVILVAILCLVAIWLIVRRGNKKRKEKIKIDIREKKNDKKISDELDYSAIRNEEFIRKKAQFTDFIKVYNESKALESNPKNGVAQNNQKEVINQNTDNHSDEIEKLAQKYQVEKEKIELALKLIAKNDTESTKDKYLLLMKMLKENMSIEELAQKLRIPKGEINLIANLKQM